MEVGKTTELYHSKKYTNGFLCAAIVFLLFGVFSVVHYEWKEFASSMVFCLLAAATYIWHKNNPYLVILAEQGITITTFYGKHKYVGFREIERIVRKKNAYIINTKTMQRVAIRPGRLKREDRSILSEHIDKHI